MFRLLAISILAFSSTAWGWQISSDSQRVALLELYTSEGCSSCPAADRWLNGLVNHPDLWQRFVPVAFHVDYWDWIGWKDRFARPSHSNRQRTYQRQGGLNAVYTPGFVVDGKEWRNWFRSTNSTTPPESSEDAGVLSLEQKGNELVARYQLPEHQAGANHYNLDFVITGFDLSNRIDAGENRGKVLEHNFVVLHHLRQMSYPLPDSPGVLQWRIALPQTINQQSQTKEPRRLAISAWVSTGDFLRPLQATGGWWRNSKENTL
ncbi:DUF1223 domain-containing protein [Aestuariirhabdus sp. Z084]|uniref:DUF1223 domain-containing protein n=1 Tax=Aestuariirhabdus haliotis TaxID=2918751 RepID=UPI00201B3F8D|nr:DUF1223 domain-containing protein [Aestuariirhabdus haliotis]MCL6415562.1 DUF1223 domain-containing protein [Aestuariirhabdus haliotis]MCL6419233.1 DUF1223 domain-containing protein [Aestuariirhabdus haliotis]